MIDVVLVGKKISALRKENKLTQDDLASKLFVTRQNVSKWEVGTTFPSLDTLVELTKIFNVSIEELLCLEEDIVINDDDIFVGHNRIFIINSIIDGSVKVDVPSVLYQMSPVERMMILRAIKENKLQVEMEELYPKLTPSEQKYLNNMEVVIYDFKKGNK
jgi:transcriptional regulator with XRE-family HTH domain